MNQYIRKDKIMSDFEEDLFKILAAILGDKYLIFPQVHLDAILKAQGSTWFGAFRHINEKSVDFVICEKDALKPLLTIELDDSSHARQKRMTRDKEVESIFHQAGLPLLRVKHEDRLNRELLTKQLLAILK